VPGSEEDLAREPKNYCRVDTRQGPRVLAHGRDPYFPGWPDTLQVNYRHRGFRDAMLAALEGIADQCDGVRCDMAMLVLPDVIARTWGERARPSDGSPPVDDPFWPAATVGVRRRRPGTCSTSGCSIPKPRSSRKRWACWVSTSSTPPRSSTATSTRSWRAWATT